MPGTPSFAWRSARMVAVLCLLPAAWPSFALSQTLQCERLLPQKGELAYRLRGDRCEGLFVRDTNSSVRLVALTASGGKPATAGPMLQTTVLAPATGKAHRMRVQSLNPLVHYQLDAIIPPSGSFSWPADLIEKAALRRTDLAPLVWMDTDPLVYLPVTMGTRTPGNAAPTVRVLFESTVPVERYWATLTNEKDGGAERLYSRSALPASMLEFDLPPRGAGRYRLWLRVLVLGESKPEAQSWLVWLP